MWYNAQKVWKVIIIKNNKMRSVKIVIGLILIAVAVYLFMFMDSPSAKYLGAAIVGILGLAAVIKGIFLKGGFCGVKKQSEEDKP